MKIDLTHFRNALQRLEQAQQRLQQERMAQASGQEDTNLIDMLQESLTQRFEFSIEQAWKAMQRVLEHDSDSKVASEARKGSRSSLRLAYEKGWIDDMDQWDEWVNLRNWASHNYDHNIPAEIARRVPSVLPILQQALQRLALHVQNSGGNE